MRVLYTEKQNDDYYSLVLTSGYDFTDGIYLVQYVIENDKVQIRDVYDAPQIFSLQNVYFGVVNQDGLNPICFGFVKKLKYNSEEDKWVDSDICNIKLLTVDKEYDIQVETSKPFITYLSGGSKITGYKAMNSQGDCIEEKELTELDYSNLLVR